MAEKYYLLSKDTGDGPYLIGELERLDRREYRFRYLIKGDVFPEWFMYIPGMGSVGYPYQSRTALQHIIHRLVPEGGSWAAGLLMRQCGVGEYDEWELMVALIEQHKLHSADGIPLGDSHQLFYLYEEIPAQANRYD